MTSELTGHDLKRILKSSYESNKKAKKTLAKSGFKLDKKLSGQRAKVFTNKKTGQGNVVYRGTSNIHDVGTDLTLPTGLMPVTKRMKHTKKVARKAEAKYGDVNAFGHSLAGLLAERSGVGGKIVTYNKATLGAKNRKKGRQTDIRTSGDVVSVLTPNDKTNITIDSKKDNFLKAHKLGHLKAIRDKKIF